MLRFVRRFSCGSVVAWGWIVAVGATLMSSRPVSAQIEVLNELYGSGVHAYNSGQYRDAYNDLTMAIRSGSKDPRVYYYRGLSYLRLGRPQEAQGDFQKAASLEMADTDHFYQVSKALERVQGSARSQIERYRSKARLTAFQTRERQRFERYQRIRKNEPNVLMTPDEAAEMPSPANEPELAEPEPEMPAEKPEAADENEPAEDMPADKADDPFAADSDKEEMPADEAAEKDEMPADEADDEKPAEKKDDDDPFAE